VERTYFFQHVPLTMYSYINLSFWLDFDLIEYSVLCLKRYCYQTSLHAILIFFASLHVVLISFASAHYTQMHTSLPPNHTHKTPHTHTHKKRKKRGKKARARAHKDAIFLSTWGLPCVPERWQRLTRVWILLASLIEVAFVSYTSDGYCILNNSELKFFYVKFEHW